MRDIPTNCLGFRTLFSHNITLKKSVLTELFQEEFPVRSLIIISEIKTKFQ